MADYPALGIDARSYQDAASDGAEMSQAVDGTPHVHILFPHTSHTFTVTHVCLDAAQQAELEGFYESNKMGYVRFWNPRYQRWFDVLMVGRPALESMPAPWLANIRMTLIGRVSDDQG